MSEPGVATRSWLARNAHWIGLGGISVLLLALHLGDLTFLLPRFSHVEEKAIADEFVKSERIGRAYLSYYYYGGVYLYPLWGIWKLVGWFPGIAELPAQALGWPLHSFPAWPNRYTQELHWTLWARMPMVAMQAAFPFLLYPLARRMLSRGYALGAVAAACMLPVLLIPITARPDMPNIFFDLIALNAVMALGPNDSRRRYFLLGLVAGIPLAVKYNYFHCIALGYRHSQLHPGEGWRKRYLDGRIALAALAAVGVYWLFMWYTIPDWHEFQFQLAIEALSQLLGYTNMIDPAWHQGPVIVLFAHIFPGQMTFPLFALAIWGAVRYVRREESLDGRTLLAFVLSYAIFASFISRKLQPMHYTTAMMVMMFFAAWAIENTKLRPLPKRAAAALALLLMVGHFTLAVRGTAIFKDRIREAIRWVEHHPAVVNAQTVWYFEDYYGHFPYAQPANFVRMSTWVWLQMEAQDQEPTASHLVLMSGTCRPGMAKLKEGDSDNRVMVFYRNLIASYCNGERGYRIADQLRIPSEGAGMEHYIPKDEPISITIFERKPGEGGEFSPKSEHP